MRTSNSTCESILLFTSQYGAGFPSCTATADMILVGAPTAALRSTDTRLPQSLTGATEANNASPESGFADTFCCPDANFGIAASIKAAAMQPVRSNPVGETIGSTPFLHTRDQAKNLVTIRAAWQLPSF